MKNKVIILILIACSLVGCKKIDELTNFKLKNNEFINLPDSIKSNNTIEILTKKLDMSDKYLSLYGTKRNLIEDINVTEIKITPFSPVNQDLSFLKYIEVYIVSSDFKDSLVAWKYSIPNIPTNEISLELANVNLKHFLQCDYFRLKIVAEAKYEISHLIKVNAFSSYIIDAKILGQ